ncbi:MAG: putative porin [Deltaproteobacteria bacterium]|nr:putative porin [Deltaproteobacteria bacterium]
MTFKNSQEQALEAVKEEFSRLNAQFDGMLKESGLSSGDLKAALEKKHSPELDKLLDQAKAEAVRAGQARKAQADAAQAPSAGLGRPGTVKI